MGAGLVEGGDEAGAALAAHHQRRSRCTKPGRRGRASPRTIRAVRVPTNASPAPVWSTTAGAGMDSIQVLTSLRPPAGSRLRRRSRQRWPRRGRGAWPPLPPRVIAAQERGRFTGEGRGDQERARRKVQRATADASSTEEPRPEIGIEHEAFGQRRGLEDRGARRCPRSRRRCRRHHASAVEKPRVRRHPVPAWIPPTRAGVGELALTVRIGVHQVYALLPGPELQPVRETPSSLIQAAIAWPRSSSDSTDSSPTRAPAAAAAAATLSASPEIPAAPERRVRRRRRWPPQRGSRPSRRRRTAGQWVSGSRSPVVHRAVEAAVHGQVLGVVREALRPPPRRSRRRARVPRRGACSRRRTCSRAEDLVGRVAVAHVLLDAEVRDADVDVQRGGHGDRREVGGAVGAGADVVQVRQVEDAAQVGDAAGVRRPSCGCSR